MGVTLRKRDFVWGVLKSNAVRALFIVWGIILMVFCATVRYIEPGEAGIEWRPISGQIRLLDTPGWQFSAPWAFVTVIDTRPQRLCLTSSVHAAPNCRLASFDTRHYREFIAVEGWSYYWFRNRLSFNFGHPETYRGWRDVMRGYAFSEKPYDFIAREE
jgi:hypothetical protein